MELKQRSICVVLFFTNMIDYNSLELANKIIAKLPQLGQPNIFNLPKDIPNEIRLQAPKLVFNSSRDISLNLTITNAELYINSIEDMGNVKNIVELLNSAITEQGIQIQSIGMVYDYVDYDCNFEKIKEVFYKDELLESDIANSSWYKKEDNLNIWKIINVEEKNGKKVLSVRVDINNKGNNENMNIENISYMVDISLQKAKSFKDELIGKIGE